MQFQIISIADNLMPFLNEDGSLMTFDDGAAAAKAAIDLTAKFGKKFQPRPIKSEGDEWKARETARFASGTYRRPLFADRDWFISNPTVADHFVHVSTEKPSMVAFTETAEHGRVDRQTRLRVGRYLQRFFPDLHPDTLRRECEMHSGAFEIDAVQFARTADEIEEVYTNGPNSCMAHDRCHFSCEGYHPTAVYAGPDLAVAYMQVGDERVSARSVVWPEKKIYSTVYGSSALSTRLQAMGYSSGDLDGARVQKIKCGNAYVMPYVDGIDVCYTDDEHIVLGRSSSRSTTHFAAQNTNGLTGRFYQCECCGDDVSRDDRTSVRVGPNTYEDRCENCLEETIYMDRYSETAALDCVTQVADGTYVYDWVLNRDYFCSEHSNEWFHDDEAVTVYVNVAGSLREQTWAASEAYDYAVTSDYSDEFYAEDDVVRLENGETWGFDEFEKNGFECSHCACNHNKLDGHKHDGELICEDCNNEVIEEKEKVEQAINALRHPMLAAAYYANFCLPFYPSSSNS